MSPRLFKLPTMSSDTKKAAIAALVFLSLVKAAEAGNPWACGLCWAACLLGGGPDCATACRPFCS
jgi:hypothetical protein